MAASVQAPLEAADPLMQAHSPSPLLDVVEGADGAAFLLPSQAAPTRVGSPLPASCAASSNECTAGEVVGPFTHKETCVVLDWDDTLFPSSFGTSPARGVWLGFSLGGVCRIEMDGNPRIGPLTHPHTIQQHPRQSTGAS